MDSNLPGRCARPVLGGILALTILSNLRADEKPYTQPGTAIPVPPRPPKPVAREAAPEGPSIPPPTAEQNWFANVFNGMIPDAIAKGKFNLNARLRYEWVDQSTFDK